MTPKSATQQMDLFGTGGAEELPSFDKVSVRAASIGAQVALAVSEMLKSAKSDEGTELERDDIARRMGDYLGQSVSVNVLNAYASQARGQHNITVARMCALCHATNDFRLLKLIAEMFDLTVIPRKFEMAVRECIMVEQRDEMDREIEAMRRRRQK